MYVLQKDTWGLVTCDDLVFNVGAGGFADGLEMLRAPTSDSYEIRLKSLGNIICRSPGKNAVVALS
jgi:hypothetical protein